MQTHVAVDSTGSPDKPNGQSTRKLCVRHKRMADEGANVAMQQVSLPLSPRCQFDPILQQSLDALPVAEREVVNRIWSTFSSSTHPSRCLILKGLLTMCCFSQLSLLSQELHNIIRIDPFSVFPPEISLRILANLDAISLGRAAQVSRMWRRLADDNMLWKSICEQHIDKKCTKCGWGLALLKKPRSPAASRAHSEGPSLKRQRGDFDLHIERPTVKRLRIEASATSTPETSRESTPRPLTPPEIRTRPWKNVYCERLKLERNWRNGRCRVRTLKGHADGVMCLQFADNMTGIKYPVLITGSYDHTVRVWNLAEGKEVRQIQGHTRAIRALQFDDAKLITGSMDATVRIWNWRTGECVKELRGHSAGVVSLNFDDDVLVSGSVDTTVRVWNFRNKDSFVLRGHLDWINSVLLWDDPSRMEHVDSPNADPSNIPAGKMLFSASDDGVVRLWDLASRQCVRCFTGHTGQIQTLKFLMVDRAKIEQARKIQERTAQISDGSVSSSSTGHPYTALPSGMPGFAPANVSVPSPPPADHPGFLSPQFLPPEGFDPTSYRNSPNSAPGDAAFSHIKPTSVCDLPVSLEHSPPAPILISGALDNTIRVWDVETGRVLNTLFGHIEGVWAVAGDKFRVVSASHDRTIKIWDRDNGTCQTTLVGHRGAVTCVALADDKIVSGSDDGDVKIWDFGFKE
jgi:F-box/WD-40 domain protein MET30